jgi:hypothetical protein
VELIGAFDDVFTADATADTQITPNVTVFALAAFLPSLSDGSLSVGIDPRDGTLLDALSVDHAELTIETAAVPEPAAAILLAVGLGVVALRRYRRVGQ